ncbi:hypothetical protein NDU88_002877 [Pleurodeles waltl]|uniref:Uncharacterized protein n=1 Tax=Pleurodeles waltl TaxID=8319 RepID=A0AAV7T3Z1_PLEWA|nr:hypothetical protein NDU88_002877 [Pleurodeles waltl]
MMKDVIQMAVERRNNVKCIVNDLVWAYRTTENGVKNENSIQCNEGTENKYQEVTSVGDYVGEQKEDDSEDYKFNGNIGQRIKAGDLVKGKQGRIEGGLKKFCGPFQVRSVHGLVVTLENGMQWTVQRVGLYERGSSDVKKTLE